MSAASRDPVIAFEDVHLDMGEGDILHGVSFQVARGETKVLIGETGSGKTLSLKLAAGLLKATRGHVRVLGRDLGAMSESELLAFRRQIGFVFQEGALFDSMSVADNVAYRLNEESVDPAEIESRVREVLRFVEMEDSIDQFPADLSGGMRRRVSIARALVSNPHVVLYDSPTAGLDPLTSQTIIMFILRLRDTEGVTSLLATHRLQDAFGLANYRFDPSQNRVIKAPISQQGSQNGQPSTNFLVLRNGEVYFEGGPQAVLETRDAYLKQFLV
jgi:phospholipid/cholesterol/gamma-HCH transport system ATP-binding protein